MHRQHRLINRSTVKEDLSQMLRVRGKIRRSAFAIENLAGDFDSGAARNSDHGNRAFADGR